MKDAEKTSHPESAADLTGRVVWQTVKAPAIRKLIIGIVREALQDWAKDSKFKARMTAGIEDMVHKVLSAESAGEGRTGAELGKLLTTFAREANARLQQGSETVEDPQKTAINDFIVHTDFGELKEMVDRCEEPLLQNIDIAIECIWKYPAKVGSVLAAVVSAGNISVKAIAVILRSLLDNLGPDLTADILLSVVRELKGQEIGKLVNTLAELLRRLHTGSYLLARGGKPLFEIYLTDFLKEALSEIDPGVLTKARIALAEDAETIARSLADVLSENEKFLFASLEAYAALTNPKIKTQSVKLRLYENVDQDRLIEAAAAGLSDLDTQLMAENFNAALRILNTLHDAKPELFNTLLRGFADAVDEDELQKAIGWLVPQTVCAFKTLAPAVMPALINGFCEAVRADAGAETQEALRNLRSLILEEGGAR